NVNDDACFLSKRGAYEFFASKLAPTGGVVPAF
ncbi:transcriptional regulator, partial [Pseudomonas sp. B2021]|nr:transcriptional regulator [Pseudomonas sp. B2021]